MSTVVTEKILTPEEYYQRAYNRIISVGNAVLATWPPIHYNKHVTYKFSWDKTMVYRWVGAEKGGYNMFVREKDGATARLTKYSERPEII